MNVNPGGDTPALRSAAIRDLALELGFSHVGFAEAGALVQERIGLEQWLAAGYQADMQWMERDVERRCDPSLVLPGARSVISVAMNYYTTAQHSQDANVAKISRYAWGDDYHDLIGEKLKLLEQGIRELVPDAETRRYVDTGPVMDKAWAVRAGIGWLGKNANVITRDLGSWVFLGEVLTTIDLEYDTPISDYCGSCTSCLEACPTQAIVAPTVVDSNRCISWLTIECREEELPMSEGMSLDNWVFGCDVCQDVCPWNSFARQTGEQAFQPRPGNAAPLLTELSEISDEAFRERFRRSPVKRSKPSGLRRNARTVLARKESNMD